jgi:hypothetical protein
MAWNMLMQPSFKELQDAIFSTREEFLRFRQLVVNTVLATDIFDPKLKGLRNMRWDKAFHDDDISRDSEMESVSSHSVKFGRSGEASVAVASSQRKRMKDLKNNSTNRKATIVIEHIIQASDVAHCMQHWSVYKRWNERLFQEMYLAYKMGRSNKDPSEGWYKGELWFFDNYVLPLAKKLNECGVFGVTSNECLFNATENRNEWSVKGNDIVTEMVTRCHQMSIKLDAVHEEKDGEDAV